MVSHNPKDADLKPPAMYQALVLSPVEALHVRAPPLLELTEPARPRLQACVEPP
jgi:hypothetical protein